MFLARSFAGGAYLDIQLKEAYEQMQAQPPASGSQGLSDESGTDNDSKVSVDQAGGGVLQLLGGNATVVY